MGGYKTLITLIVIGFFILAGLLLGPIYLFLKREEETAEKWTREDLIRRQKEHSGQSESTSSTSPSEAETVSPEAGEGPDGDGPSDGGPTDTDESEAAESSTTKK